MTESRSPQTPYETSFEDILSQYEEICPPQYPDDIPLPTDDDAPPEESGAFRFVPPEEARGIPDMPPEESCERETPEPAESPDIPDNSETPDKPYKPISAVYGVEIPSYMRSAANVKPANHSFLLGDSRFPMGEIAIIAGAGGTGKGQLACAHMAATSKGCNLLGERVGAPKRSLFISAEDTAEDIKRRIDRSAFPADDRQILLIGKTESYQEEIDLSDRDKLDMLKGWILVSGADAVYIDPLQAFVGEYTDLSRQNHVRMIMHSLAAIAEETQCCIVLIMHLNKRQQIVSAADLLCGSSDIVNASRSAMLLTNDFKDGDPDRRYLFHIKSNHARSAKTLELNIGAAGNRIVGESELTPEDYVVAVNTRKTGKSARDGVDYEQMFYSGIEQMIAEGTLQMTYREFVEKYASSFMGRPKYILDDISVRVEEQLGHVVQTRLPNRNPIKFNNEGGFRLCKLNQ